MTDLEMAGRALVTRQPVPVTPVEEIRERADAVARRRRVRRRAGWTVVGVVVVMAVVASAALWTVRGRHEGVATTPSSVPSTLVIAPPPSVAPSTTVTAVPNRGVTAARLTRADLGMAATYDPVTGLSRLWLTRDSRTWQDVTPGHGLSSSVEDVFALDDQHLWATSYDCARAAVTAWRSVDGGRTWNRAAAGNHSCSLGTAHVQFVDALHGWIVLNSPTGPDASLEMTSDGGATWTLVDPRLPEPGDIMFYTPRDGYLGAGPTGQFAFGTSALYVTHDAGRTWARVTIHLGDPGLPNPSWTVIYGVPTFVDDSTGVLPVTVAKANTAAVEWWETTDGGTSWHLRTPAATAPAGVDATPEPMMSPLLSSVTGPHVWWVLARTWTGTHSLVTTDAGAHWTDTNDPRIAWPNGHWFGAANADAAWVLGPHLLATTDGGHTWTRIDPGS